MMKNIRLFLGLLFALSLFLSCAKKYEEETGAEFKGTFVLKTIEEKGQPLKNGGDSLFIQIKSDKILTYVRSVRDSTQSYMYQFKANEPSNIYSCPLNKDNVYKQEDFKYFASYHFEGNKLLFEKFAYKNDGKTLNHNDVLVRYTYERP